MEQHAPVKQEDPVSAVLRPALKVGVACGCAGFLFGGTSGIIRGTEPFLFATASSFQTFALGTTFWTCRSLLLQTGLAARQEPADLATVSTLAGGISGSLLAALTRGRRSILPAALMWSLTGCLGQVAYNRYSNAPVEESSERKQGFWERTAKRKWSPMTFLSNEEYAEILREKMFKLDVEIAVIDDKLKALSGEESKILESERKTEEASSATT
ncbi:hypothetical protein LTR62_000117 [Meristemomyces frigidus]|uniref:Uncharacterized protein n=1 Tax=Meristemomyces frigidus TaxID=1508187 RepID=A0AAN7TQT5_9PEZI|nr:hypothetical protein LTR62_000117 [Meristemomyces frigidus]